MPNPKPGIPVRGSTTGRPIMALLDLIGRRWALRIIWELRERVLTFRELRTACDEMSPTVLNQRLAELRDADILENGEKGYQLTAHGLELISALGNLHIWAENWVKRQK